MAFSKRTLVGYGVMLVFILCWTASAVSVQLLERRVPDFQLSAARYFGSGAFALILLLILKVDFKVPKELWGYILVVAVYSLLYVAPLFAAAAVLPVAHTACVPLVFTSIAIAVICRVILRDPISIITLLSICGCTLGTILLVQPWEAPIDGFIPGFINTTSDSTSSSHDYTSDFSIWMPIFGYFCLAVAGIANAVCLVTLSIIVKKLNPGLIWFIVSILNIPICALLSLYTEEPVWITDPYTLFLVFVHLVTSGAGLVAEGIALMFISAAQASIIQTLGAIFNLIPQYTFLSAHLGGKMNVLEVAGSIVIVFSTITNELQSTAVPDGDLE